MSKNYDERYEEISGVGGVRAGEVDHTAVERIMAEAQGVSAEQRAEFVRRVRDAIKHSYKLGGASIATLIETLDRLEG